MRKIVSPLSGIRSPLGIAATALGLLLAYDSPSGAVPYLVLDFENDTYGTPSLGPEVLSSAWSQIVGSGTASGTGTSVTFTGAADNDRVHAAESKTLGATYRYDVTVTGLSGGSIRLSDGVSVISTLTTNGTYTYHDEAGAADIRLSAVGAGPTSASVTISIKKLQVGVGLRSRNLNDLLGSVATGNRTTTDSDGLIKWAPHNVLVHSEDFTQANWAKNTQGSGVAPSVSANTATAPNGEATADVVTFNCAGSTSGDRSRLLQNFASPVSSAGYTGGIYLRSPSGDKDVQLYVTATGTGSVSYTQQITVPSSWQLFAGACTMGTSATTLTVEVRAAGDISGSSAFNLEVWGGHAYRSDLGGMQENGSDFPTYRKTEASAFYGARIDHDPVTLAVKGLLVEESRTNLWKGSINNLSGGDTTRNDITVTANYAVGKTGRQTASRVVVDAQAGAQSSWVRQQIIVTGSTDHIASILVKKTGSYDHLAIQTLSFDSTQTTFFNINTGAVGSMQHAAAGVIPYGDGWYRCWCRFSSVTDVDGLVAFYFTDIDDGNANLADPDGTGTFLAEAPQVTQGSLPSSYIPTPTGATASRVADTPSILTSAFAFNAVAGTLKGSVTPDRTPTAERVYVSLSDGTANERIEIYADASANIKFRVVDGGATRCDIDSGVNAAAGTEFVFAAAWAAGDFAFSVDGNAAVTGGSGALPTVTTLRIGHDYASAKHQNATTGEITYYGVREPNAGLVTLSEAA